MKITVYTMMFGWPVVTLVLFSILRPRHAVLASLLAGWLLLPQAVGFKLSGIPDYSRVTAVVLGLVVGVLIFDSGRISHIRLGLFDLPIVVWCLCPLASSISNGLGIYDGISGVLTASIQYGIPYLIGRLYFAEQIGMRELALGLIIALICYVPLILFELRMSPQLHRHLYGYLQIPFKMIWRLGWYRPMVFLRHGLELGVLLAGAAITATWLWRSRSITRVGWLSASLAALTLLLVCLLCRALNGYFVLILGLGALYTTKIFKSRAVLILLALIPIFYVYGRVETNWHAAPLVNQVESIDPLRAKSLQSRISHEITLIDKALRRPYFGWGGYDRNRAETLAVGAMGKRSITDSYWIIVFGKYGMVGLLSFGFVLLLPIMKLVKRLPAAKWSFPDNAPAAALSMVLLGFTIDSLANAMFNPLYFLIAGSLMHYEPVLEPVQNTQVGAKDPPSGKTIQIGR